MKENLLRAIFQYSGECQIFTFSNITLKSIFLWIRPILFLTIFEGKYKSILHSIRQHDEENKIDINQMLSISRDEPFFKVLKNS